MTAADIMLTISITVDRDGVLRAYANPSQEVAIGAHMLLLAGALAEAQRLFLSGRHMSQADTALRERLKENEK